VYIQANSEAYKMCVEYSEKLKTGKPIMLICADDPALSELKVMQ
jgi:hypothetical protein